MSRLWGAWDQGKAECLGLGLEAFEAARAVFGFELGEDRLIVGGAGAHQLVEDACEQVGQGGEGFGSAKSRAQAPVAFAQGIMRAVQAERGLAQVPGEARFAPAGAGVQRAPAADFGAGTETEPGAEGGGGGKGTQVRADFARGSFAR